jgi:hypothetical protein
LCRVNGASAEGGGGGCGAPGGGNLGCGLCLSSSRAGLSTLPGRLACPGLLLAARFRSEWREEMEELAAHPRVYSTGLGLPPESWWSELTIASDRVGPAVMQW